MPQELRATNVEIDGAVIDVEIRGRGPALCLMPGASGVRLFDDLADRLAAEFTVVAIERPGRQPTARSSFTSVQQRAAETAELLNQLGLAPAAVYAHNGGANTALELVLRDPDLVRGAVLHEPPLISVLEQPGEAMADLDEALSSAGRGSRAVFEAFVHAQEPALGDGHDDLRERLLADADRFVVAEAEIFAGYHPNEATLARNRVPLLLLHGSTSAPHHSRALRWLAERVGADVIQIPGGHWTFLDDAAALVAAMRPFLLGVSQSPVPHPRADSASTRGDIPCAS